MVILQGMIKTIIFSLFLFLLLTPLASAEYNTNISVKSNTGSNTICKNGECTTTEGENHSKVCVNGDCYESEAGNVDVKAVNGVMTVKVNDTVVSSKSSTPTVTPEQDPELRRIHTYVEPAVKGVMTTSEKKTDWVEIISSHALSLIKKIFFFSLF